MEDFLAAGLFSKENVGPVYSFFSVFFDLTDTGPKGFWLTFPISDLDFYKLVPLSLSLDF